MSAPAGGDALRWYTRGLRIPKFIGRLATGEFIKGGPYPQSQVATFAAVIVLGIWSMDLWGPLVPDGDYAFFARYGCLIAVAVALSFAVRAMPQTAVNPAAMAVGAVRSATRPNRQLYAGRPLTSGRRTSVRVAATVTDLDLQAWLQEPQTLQPDHAAPTAPTGTPAHPQPAHEPTPAPTATPRRPTRVEDKLAALLVAQKG